MQVSLLSSCRQTRFVLAEPGRSSLEMRAVEEGQARLRHGDTSSTSQALPLANRPVDRFDSNVGKQALKWITTYRLLFCFCMAANLALAIPPWAGRWHWAKENAARFAVANIVLTLIVRNELFLRVAYRIEIMLFR